MRHARRRLALVAALAGTAAALSPARAASPDEAAAEVRARIEASPKLPLVAHELFARPPSAGWKSGMVSWVAFDAQGRLYELQRGEKAPPVLLLDRNGKVLRGWGEGNYTIPHAVRIDPKGNVWTVDAGASRVIEYSPGGEKLMTIEVGEAPYRANGFSGTSDIAFGSNGHLYITDGYGNARVLEYSAEGRRLRQWGEPGTGPGQFRLPHAIQIGQDGVIYVADRENGRIQKFDMDGKTLGEIGPL
ncbi:MAG: 6-bladed beta-propeller, partial [Proteobacteria bacterium]|nr:6-bladed beta-propeller [Pseudomonadota bacterium]